MFLLLKLSYTRNQNQTQALFTRITEKQTSKRPKNKAFTDEYNSFKLPESTFLYNLSPGAKSQSSCSSVSRGAMKIHSLGTCLTLF